MSEAAAVNVALMHPFDPRSAKVGGIETFIRDYITYHPDDMNILLVGVDSFSDLPLGEITRINFRGREISFLPVMRVPEDDTNVYAKSIFSSVTLQFALALMKHGRKLRKLLNDGKYSIDLRRIEFSIATQLFGRPTLQMLHDGMSKDKQMSSLLRRFWWVKEFSEKVALARAEHFYCVNDDLTQRLKTENPRHAAKLGTLPTWANPQIFASTPFPKTDGLHIAYTGRMDAFKRPDIMFQVVAALRRRREDTHFHYVGDGDVESFSEFAEIRDCTTLHGKVKAEDLAKILRDTHIGILTSDFEGMPRSTMEFLASGRPVVALHLPQLEAVIHEGRSGRLVARGSDQIERFADAVLATKAEMDSAQLTPEGVSQCIEAYSPQALLGKLFEHHRQYAARKP